MTLIDIIVIAFYLIGIMVIGLLVVRKKSMNTDGYFLAERSLKWPVIGAALFASNISSLQFIALSGYGFKMGLAIATYEWMAALTLIIVAVFSSQFI